MTEREFLEIAMPHLARLLRFAKRLCADFDLADDLVQDTYLQSMKARAQLLSPDKSLVWMFGIMRNRYLSERRESARRLELLQSEPAFLEEPIANLEEEILHSAVSDEVEAALGELPEDLRTSLLLCDVEGLSYEEIAAVMGCPTGTIASRIARARTRLLKRLLGFAQERGIGRSYK